MSKFCHVIITLSIMYSGFAFAQITPMQHEQVNTTSTTIRSKNAPSNESKNDPKNTNTPLFKVGTNLPETYRDKTIDHKKTQGLSEPSQYQQWVKVEHQYILYNLLTNTIIKIVPDQESKAPTP